MEDFIKDILNNSSEKYKETLTELAKGEPDKKEDEDKNGNK